MDDATRALVEAGRELEEVRLAARRFREAVLAALGWTDPWAITVIREQQIVTAIAVARQDSRLLEALEARVRAPHPWRDIAILYDPEDGLWLAEVDRGELRGARALDHTSPPTRTLRAAIAAAAAWNAWPAEDVPIPSPFTGVDHDDHAAPATEPVPEPDAHAAPPHDGGGEGRDAAMDGGD